MNGKTCEDSETDPLLLLAAKLIACGLSLPLVSAAWISPAIAETAAGANTERATGQLPVLSQNLAPDKVAQAELQRKLRKGPIEAPGPVQEYELNKGPITPGPIEEIQRERGPIVAAPEQSGGGTPPDMSEMLNVHNERRARHCVPALTWSSDLAKAAQAYAEKCQLYQHGSTGENMANWVTIKNGEPVLPAMNDRQVFENAWYCEIENYNFNAPKIVGGFKQNCDPPVNGHFTQIVWRSTQQLGCGRTTCNINGQLGTNWVCRYAPAGNDGPPGPNVPPPCK